MRGAGECGGGAEDGRFAIRLDQGCEADGWDCGLELADFGAVVFEFAGFLRGAPDCEGTLGTVDGALVMIWCMRGEGRRSDGIVQF